MSLNHSMSVDGMSGNVQQRSLYTDLAQLPDEVLMNRLLEGQHNALTVLFDRYHRMVLNIAMRILRDTGEAEDLMQSVFFEVFRSARQFDPAKGSFKIWILQSVYNRGFNRRRYLNLRGIYEHREERDLVYGSPSKSCNVRSLGVVEAVHVVQQALKQLSKAQRRTLELVFYEGYTMREIAGKTGETFDSVRHNYYRGLEKLRSVLHDTVNSHATQSSQQERVPHVQS
jgi:RNA polymerase sigma-70 factor (ECF subfamily)